MPDVTSYYVTLLGRDFIGDLEASGSVNILDAPCDIDHAIPVTFKRESNAYEFLTLGHFNSGSSPNNALAKVQCDLTTLRLGRCVFSISTQLTVIETLLFSDPLGCILQFHNSMGSSRFTCTFIVFKLLATTNALHSNLRHADALLCAPNFS